MSYTEESKKKHRDLMKSMATTEFTDELRALVRSRAPLIYLCSNEERRLLEYLRHMTVSGGYKTYVWDCFRGLLDLSDMTPARVAAEEVKDPEACLDLICKEAIQQHQNENYDGPFSGFIYVLLDFHRFLEDPLPSLERRLKTIARTDSLTTVIMTGPHYQSSPALDKEMSVLDFPFPNREEIKSTLYTIVNDVAEKCTGLDKRTKDREDALIDSVTGLTLNEAGSAFAKSIVQHKDFNISTILKEKRQIIRKSGVLDYIEPTVGMDDIGGLSVLRDWIKKRKVAFAPGAAEYGLPVPRGLLLTGPPGVGKSLIAKAIAMEYELPLLRLDFGRMFQSLIGASEEAARNCIKMAEVLSPIILWIDEVEKGLSGTRSSGSTDGGTTNRVVSTFLTWMQEKTKPVFVVCTANNHEDIPSEFMRRFDEIFFVDLPSVVERAEVFAALLRRRKRNPKDFDLKKMAASCENYSGSEIEKGIDMALFNGFAENKREITTDDIISSMQAFKPLYEARKEQFDNMREWADGRCLRANAPDVKKGELSVKKNLQI